MPALIPPARCSSSTHCGSGRRAPCRVELRRRSAKRRGSTRTMVMRRSPAFTSGATLARIRSTRRPVDCCARVKEPGAKSAARTTLAPTSASTPPRALFGSRSSPTGDDNRGSRPRCSRCARFSREGLPRASADVRLHPSSTSSPRVAGPRVAGPRVAGPRVAGPRAAAPRVAAPRVAAPRVAGPRVAGPRVAGPRVAGPRVAGPRVAGPRVAGPRVAGPRVAGPRAAAPRVAAPRVAGPFRGGRGGRLSALRCLGRWR